MQFSLQIPTLKNFREKFITNVILFVKYVKTTQYLTQVDSSG